jgi:mevalonate kinase
VSEATAPGKIILFGEHAVVYGQPAIAVPLPSVQAHAVVRERQAGTGLVIVAANLGRTIVVRPQPEQGEHALATAARLLVERLGRPLPDGEVLIHSTIPVASGLGSGAAVTTALLGALRASIGQPLSLETLNELVYEIEKLHHGTPSGIDNTVIVYQRPVYFVRNQPIETFKIGGVLHLVVADTGVASPTHLTVGDVRKLYEADPARIQPIFDRIGAIAREARGAIESGEAATLGILMHENQALLRELTVSSEELDRLIGVAEEAGALGAKLSGGGRGGNLIALVAPDRMQAVSEALLAAGAVRTITTALEGTEPA